MYDQMILKNNANRMELGIGYLGLIWSVTGIYDHFSKYFYHNNYGFIGLVHQKWARFVPFFIVIPGFISTFYFVYKATFNDNKYENKLILQVVIWILFGIHSTLSNYTFNKIDRDSNWLKFEIYEFATHISDILYFTLLNWAINHNQ